MVIFTLSCRNAAKLVYFWRCKQDSTVSDDHWLRYNYTFQGSTPRWIILCLWFMESVLCVTWGLGAWSSAVSTTQSQFVCSRILFHGVIYEINCTNLCSQWMISAACHSSFCTVTLRNRWMSTPSAGWSFYLSSGTLLYTEMLLGWTGEDSTLDANTAWHKRKSCDTYYQLLRCRNSVCGWKTQSFSSLYFLFFFFAFVIT